MPAETDPIRATLTDEEAAAEARRIIADFATSYRDHTPVPKIGDAPPVPQPGRPPMSERATDASVMMTAAGFLSLCLGAAVSAVLHFSGNANETVVIAVCAGPPATVFALKSLVGKAKQALPTEIHNHYSGPVDQRTTHSSTRGVWARTSNTQ